MAYLEFDQRQGARDGLFKCVQDHAFDINKLCWDPYLCEKLGIPMSMLPEVKPSSCIYGKLAHITGIEDIAEVPIAGAIGDQPGALFGQGCFKAGQAKILTAQVAFCL